MTQICGFEPISKLRGVNNELKQNKDIMVTGGDSNLIEFIYLDKKDDDSAAAGNSSFRLRIDKIDSLKLDHGDKINCLRYSNGRLYVSDTTKNLTIYDFSNFLFN